jgi:hypothetical protein
MATERIGFASQTADGTWGPIFATDTQARQWARSSASPVRRDRTAMPILCDVPDVPPRPTVTLANGARIRWHSNRGVYVVVVDSTNTDVPSVVELVRAQPVTDAELDALQALPAETAAWIAAGGRD